MYCSKEATNKSDSLVAQHEASRVSVDVDEDDCDGDGDDDDEYDDDDDDDDEHDDIFSAGRLTFSSFR